MALEKWRIFAEMAGTTSGARWSVVLTFFVHIITDLFNIHIDQTFILNSVTPHRDGTL